MLLVEGGLMDTVIRLCEACAEVLADGLIRELYRMKRELNSGIRWPRGAPTATEPTGDSEEKSRWMRRRKPTCWRNWPP